MITSEKAMNLIKIYTYVCERYEHELKYLCERHSNNNVPRFSDEEVLTVYLFCGAMEKRTTVIDKHRFAKDYLTDWFPNLPSYQTFNTRLNRMGEALRALSSEIISSFKPEGADMSNSIVDSMPVITCAGRNRKGKVAREIADKGFCSTKNMYYYGVKIHLLAHRVKGNIPFPEMLSISAASENDSTVFKRDFVDYLTNKTVFADKIYQDVPFYQDKWRTQRLEVLTPCKAVKGEPLVLKQRFKAFRDLYSSAVSTVRQPIESFFNWLNEKTSIQRANYVRSTKGLIVHLMGNITIAFINLIF